MDHSPKITKADLDALEHRLKEILTEAYNEARVAERRILQAIRAEISENDQKLLDAYAHRMERVARKLERLDARTPKV